MVMKILKIFVSFAVIFLAFGIYIHYDLIQEPPKEEFMCYKGKLIRSLEMNNIYLQVKDTKCEVFEDLIVIDKEVIK